MLRGRQLSLRQFFHFCFAALIVIAADAIPLQWHWKRSTWQTTMEQCAIVATSDSHD
jgi:hypothetical protein